MSDEAPAVASAIIIPEPEFPAAASPRESTTHVEETRSLKRRQSESSDTDSKRRRLSTEDRSIPAGPKQDEQRDVRRRSGQVEERKRGQRLFGALLGTLSQGKPNTAHKKREEIEKRQQEKLRHQQEEESQRRKERLNDLRAARRLEQKDYDAETMRIRHANMLRLAGLLQTNTEPRIYYKPWDPLLEQQEQIRQQIEEAEKLIASELGDLEGYREAQRQDEPKTHDTHGQDTETDKSNEVGPELTQEATDSPLRDAVETANIAEPMSIDEAASIDANKANADASSSEGTLEGEMKDAVDETHGEQVVEADEDTMIF